MREMKGVDMTTQLINTGASSSSQKVSNKQGGSKSDQSDFEKMLENAGQQQDVAASDGSAAGGTTSESGSADTNTAAGVEEPGTEQMVLAAALITQQPIIPVDTITPVTVEEIAPAGAQAAALPEAVAAVQQAPEQVLTVTEQQVDVEAAPEEAVQLAEPEQAVEAVAEEAAPEDNVKAEHQETTVKDSEPEVTDASAATEAPVFEGTETVPVKVAETGEPVEAEAEDAAEQIAKRIGQAIVQGESKVEISLTPESLGQLTVEITRSGDGTLSIVLTTVNEKAANLIDRHAASLQQLLTDGAQNVHVEIETRTHETAAQQFLNPDGQNEHQQNQQQRQKKDDGDSHDEDFLQQLRLGLVGMD